MAMGYAPGRHDMRARGLEQALVPKDRRALLAGDTFTVFQKAKLGASDLDHSTDIVYR